MQSRKLIGIAIGIALAGLTWGQDEHSASYKERGAAAKLLTEGKYADARAAYQAIGKTHKDMPPKFAAYVARYVGATFQYEKNYPEARKVYAGVIKDYADLSPVDAASAALSMGACFSNEGNLDEALEALNNAPGQSADAEGRLLNALVACERNAAGILARKKDLDGALARLDAAKAKYPRLNTQQLMGLELSKARLMVLQKQYSAALRQYEVVATGSTALWSAAMAGVYEMGYRAYANAPEKRAWAWESIIEAYPGAANIAHVRQVVRGGAAVSAEKRARVCMSFIRRNIRELGCAPGSVIAQMIDAVDPRAVTTEDYVAYLDESLRVAQAATQNVEYLTKLKNELNRLK